MFHQGAPHLGEGGLSTSQGRERLSQIAAAQLPLAGQAQVAISLRMLDALEAELDAVRRRLLAAARHLRGARTLAESIYGAGPITGLALTCRLGR